MSDYYLLLGSNMGDREKNLRTAIQHIANKLGKVVAESSVYETEPWGKEDQAPFLNMAIQVESAFEPLVLLDKILQIQQEMGKSQTEHWGPRNIDIDILYCDDVVLKSEKLTIPHPRLYERNFALVPLIEIAGDFTDPVHQITVDEIYDRCTDKKEVYLYEN
jgi:2-amino-4-hydroxy-6-hydroxymethyldihydropteridine diphosphokinase